MLDELLGDLLERGLDFTEPRLYMLAIIRKRRILDFGRPVGVNEVAELEAQVLEISTGSRMLPEFLNDGL
ncbi:MAG TPA: hypothetical protein VHW09_24135, partial [Bryobacteraceae bacterium]|nr:hypothetical protein [Bryobacteraceae bacterium]